MLHRRAGAGRDPPGGGGGGIYNVYIIYSHQQKLVLLHLWRVNVKTIGGFINITFADFFIDKAARIIILRAVQIL